MYCLSVYEILNKLYHDNKKGYSEKEIKQAEEKMGIRFPKKLRDYYLTYGKLSINECLHELMEPKDVFWAFPEEEPVQESQKYLAFWVENQGVWHMGIRKDDLLLDSPPVFINTDDGGFEEWELIGKDFDNFLLFMIWHLMEYAFCYHDMVYRCNIQKYASLSKEEAMIKIDADIRKMIQENGLDVQKLLKHPKKIVACWAEKTDQMFFFQKSEGVFIDACATLCDFYQEDREFE